jgi:hypothetical protein
MMENSTSKTISRWSLFGPPPILEGEDAAAYDELVGRICAAVKPVDVIDEIFMADVAASEWEVLRWRRLKLSLIRARALKALEGFLRDKLDYDLYREHFVDELTPILQDNLAEDQAEDLAQTLAHECARNDPDAVDKVTRSGRHRSGDEAHPAAWEDPKGQRTHSTIRAARIGRRRVYR